MTGRYRYVVYGIVVESEFRLTSIDDAAEANEDAAVRLVEGSAAYFIEKTRGLVPDPDDWIAHFILVDGSIYIKVAEVFEAVISPDGRTAVCLMMQGADERSFEANLLNFILSAALTLQGEELLHGTVVDLGGEAVGLIGPSGAGKSTLAAYFIAQGAKLVTDDMLRLTFAGGRTFAHFGPQRLKLFDEPAQRFLPGVIGEGDWNTLSGKIMVRPHGPIPGRHTPRPLSALFRLEDPALPDACGTVSATRLAGADLIRALTSSAMNIRYYALDRLARQLRFAGYVAGVLPVYALRYARSYLILDRVAAEISRTVRS